MSQTRMSQQEFKDYYYKSIMTGLIIGPVTSTLTFPVDKVAFVYQTLSKQSTPTITEALRIAFRHPFNGYLPSLISASCKNVIMFPTKAFFDYEIEQLNPGGTFNKNFASFLAGTAAVYLNSPIAVIKALRLNNVPAKQIMNLNVKDFYRGTHAIAVRDGIQLCAYFELFSFLNPKMQNPVIAGAVSNLIASLLNNPFSVIAMNQRIKGTQLVAEAKTLYREGGLGRFYRGFGYTMFCRMAIQGAATGAVIHAADALYEKMTKLNSM